MGAQKRRELAGHTWQISARLAAADAINERMNFAETRALHYRGRRHRGHCGAANLGRFSREGIKERLTFQTFPY